jgi:hypothetical protein
MIVPIVLMMVIPTSVIAQSGFTEYDSKYFTIAYPSDWTVNDTAIGDLSMCCWNQHHDISFTAPDHDAKVSLAIYGPVFNNTLDKSYWLDQFPYGNIISIDNQTYYMSGRQAAVITLTANNNKQMDVVTFAQVHFPNPCDTKSLPDKSSLTLAYHLMLCYGKPFQFMLIYTSSIDKFPTYLNQFQTMVAKFHVNA